MPRWLSSKRTYPNPDGGAVTIIRQGQGWWPTAIIRPLFAASFIVFTVKVVVYDKVLGLGTTDALDPSMCGVFQAVIYAYFGGRTIEKVARIFKR